MTGGQRGAPESGGVEKGQGPGSTFDRGGHPPCRDGKVLTRVASEDERCLHQPWTFAHGRESRRSYPSDDSGLGWQGPCRYLLLSLICAWVIKGAGLHEGDPRRRPAGTGIGRRTLTRAALLRRSTLGASGPFGVMRLTAARVRTEPQSGRRCEAPESHLLLPGVLASKSQHAF